MREKKLDEETLELKSFLAKGEETATQAKQMNSKQQDAKAHGQKTSKNMAILNLAEAPQQKEGLKQKLADEEKKLDEETSKLKQFLVTGAQTSTEAEQTTNKQTDADAHGGNKQKKKNSLALLAWQVHPLGSLAIFGVVASLCFMLVLVFRHKVRRVNLPGLLLG